MITFTVYGKAKPAGSKRGFLRGGKIVITDTSGQEGKIWRHVIQDQAKEAMKKYTEFIGQEIKDPLIIGPVTLMVTFDIKRPRHHYGTGKNSGKLLERYANAIPTSKPDCTKLLRAVEDALTGIVWRDDAQVFRQIVTKHYGEADVTFVKIIPWMKTEEKEMPFGVM
jgi:Holliday junction resolvase RusA-like endonuclease